MSAGVEIARLIALVGEERTLKLLELYAGTWVDLPASLTRRSRVAAQIGLEGARALYAEYGGARVYMPLAKKWRATAYRARGLTHRQIALRLGCNEPQVGRYLRGAPARQLELGLPRPSGDAVTAVPARA